MNDLQQILATVLGIAMILVGLVLIVVRKDSAASHVKIWNVEVNLSTPALVVLVVGCGLFVLPIFVPHKAASWSWNIGGRGGTAPAPGREITQAEAEPNNTSSQANIVAFGAVATGSVDDAERDFFRVDVPNGRKEKNRFILRRLSTDGGLTVSVADNNGQQLFSEFTTSFSISKVLPPGSHYVARVDGWRSTQDYEILIRAEEPAPPK